MGIRKHKLIHRLVSEAFIEKEDGKTEVNHIDKNKKNNNLYNLEWVEDAKDITHTSNIIEVCRGRRKSAAGYLWSY